jgi:hypothetical protein
MVAGYKIYRNHSVRRYIEEKALFITATKKIKHLERTLKRNVQNLYKKHL